jgi:hypothetical protein
VKPGGAGVSLKPSPMSRPALSTRLAGAAARHWLAGLALLVAARLAVPLAVYGAEGDTLPAVPRWDYVAQTGDAQGFYAAAREFIAAWSLLPRAAVAVVAVAAVAGVALGVREWRRRPERRAWLVVGGALGVALVAVVGILEMKPAGAAVFGWSLLWAVPMLPLRAAGALDWDSAFAVGFVLSLAINAVGIVAAAVAGARATGSRALGLLAGGLVAAWPLLVAPIAGESAWENGQWFVDVGLHLYTEPLSTALAMVALALLLKERLTPLALAGAGVLLSYATLVKLSNGLLVAGAVLLVARRVGPRRALPFLAGGLTFMPTVAAYWDLGYVQVFDNPQSWPTRPFSIENVVPGWRDSLVFHPHTLAIIVPLAVIGAWALRRRPWALVLLVAWVLVNAVFYSLYRNLPQHPRFLYGSLPALWILTAAGAGLVVRTGWAAATRGRAGPGPGARATQ